MIRDRGNSIHGNAVIFASSLLLLFLAVVSCQQPPYKEVQPSQLVPDPYVSDRDELYALYRKGLITRHIARNGRLLEMVSLESIDEFDEDEFIRNGLIHINNEYCNVIAELSFDNVRYSSEEVPYTTEIASHFWIPLIAPVKYPGYSNDYYCVVSSGGNNPLFYGGIALALFSLEAKHNVSTFSIQYARNLVQYFLASEMVGNNGYMIRRPGFFDSESNPFGEPVIQGADAQELLGVMLGLMFYLRVEDQSHPLFVKAEALRKRILKRIPKESEVCIGGYPVKPGNYEHPFMLSATDTGAPMSHFAFPLFASGGISLKPKPFIECGAQKEYVKLLTGAAGWSRNIANLFAQRPFHEYAAYLTSIILVLESDEGTISFRVKQQLAEVFMEDFIKAAYTSGLDKSNLKNNAYFGVTAKLVNKYLSKTQNSEAVSQKLRAIWGDELRQWEILMNYVNDVVMNATSDPTKNGSSPWQNNLPLMKPMPGDGDEYIRNLWKDHNKHRKIGGVFVWSDPYPYRFRKPAAAWYESFPGWNYGIAENESGYLRSADTKKYARTQLTGFIGFQDGYLNKELNETRRHYDNQVEGAGLDLLFLRMLLTDINHETFPAPKLMDMYDRNFQVLSWPGVEPMHPQFLHFEENYTFDNYTGDKEDTIQRKGHQALHIMKLGESDSTSSSFVLGYPGDGNILHLKSGHVSVGADNSGERPKIYLSPESTQWKRFDKAAFTRTRDEENEDIILVAERAEEMSISGVVCDHWLRLSLWRVSDRTGDIPGSINHVSMWESTDRHCENVKDLDIAMVNRNHAAVLYISRENRAYLQVFRLDVQSKRIIPVMTKRVGGRGQTQAFITTAYDNHVIYSATDPNGTSRLSLYSGVFDGDNFHSTSQISMDWATILDITAIEGNNTSHIVAAAMKEDHLIIYSWEIDREGTLQFRGQFHAIQDSAEEYLVGSEADWKQASISSVSWQDRGGFVIAGKGAAREVRDHNREWKKSGMGLKVVYGYIMNDGRPTIESSNVIGSGEEISVSMLDLAGDFQYGDHLGVLTAHETHDRKVMLVLWTFRDDFQRISIH